MKNKFLIVLLAAAVWLPGQFAFAGDDTTDLQALVAKVEAKIQAGQNSETNFTDELKQFDKLIAQDKKNNPDMAAQILWMKAMLYVQVFNDMGQGAKLIKQLKDDYPNTKYGKAADGALALLAKQAAAQKIQAGLVVGSTFPNFNVQDVDGKPLSVADYKGKVVLVDFWATWCPPCRAEIPNVVATYKKFHDKGFDIIGISLDEDKTQLLAFTKEQDMPWPQYFDGARWDNKLAVKYGVEAIPSDFLLDGNGKIIGKDLRGDELETAVANALAKK